jgi:hypothetical protein
MSLWLQNLLVILIVACCVAVVGRQLVSTFRFGKGAKLGSCCAKGCDAQAPQKAERVERIVFIPSDSLVRRRH